MATGSVPWRIRARINVGETPRIGVAGGIAAGFAVLVTSLALACLARFAPPPEPRPEPDDQPMMSKPASALAGRSL